VDLSNLFAHTLGRLAWELEASDHLDGRGFRCPKKETAFGPFRLLARGTAHFCVLYLRNSLRFFVRLPLLGQFFSIGWLGSRIDLAAN